MADEVATNALETQRRLRSRPGRRPGPDRGGGRGHRGRAGRRPARRRPRAQHVRVAAADRDHINDLVFAAIAVFFLYASRSGSSAATC